MPLSWYNPARVLETQWPASCPLEGLPVIDGVQVSDGDRILIHWQDDHGPHSLYTACLGPWGRLEEAQEEGAALMVEEGERYGSTMWVRPFQGAAFTQLVGTRPPEVPSLSLRYAWGEPCDILGPTGESRSLASLFPLAAESESV